MVVSCRIWLTANCNITNVCVCACVCVRVCVRVHTSIGKGHRMSTLEEDGHDKKCVELEMTYESHQGLVRSMPPAARKALKEFRLWSCDVIKLERSVQDYG